MSVRIVAVTQDDPFFTGRFFETFLEAVEPAGVDVVQVVLLPNFNESRVALARRLAGFYPPADLARLAARYVRARLGDRLQIGVMYDMRAIRDQLGEPQLPRTVDVLRRVDAEVVQSHADDRMVARDSPGDRPQLGAAVALVPR